MNRSWPGSSVHEILQARVLEWVASPFSNPGIKLRSPALQADSLPSEPPGSASFWLPLINHLFNAWHCTKFFHLSSQQPSEVVTIFITFYGWRKGGTELLSDLPEVLQPESRGWIKTIWPFSHGPILCLLLWRHDGGGDHVCNAHPHILIPRLGPTTGSHTIKGKDGRTDWNAHCWKDLQEQPSEATSALPPASWLRRVVFKTSKCECSVVT